MSTQETEPTESAFFTSIRNWGIVRGPEGLIGGVISGVGVRVGMAPWAARIIVILAALLLFPIIMLAYAAGWALLPDAEGNIVIQNFGRGVMNTGALIGIAILTIVGVFSFSDARPFGRAWFGPDIAAVDGGTPLRVLAIMFMVLVPIAVIAGVVALIVVLSRRSNTARSADPADPGTAQYALTPAQARAAHATADASPATASASAPAATSSPYWAAPAPKPVKPLAPPKPRVPGPGRGFYLSTLAWALIAAAGIAWAQREDLLSIYPVLAWGMLFLTGLGLILIAVSLSGRKLGFLGFLGIVGSIPALILLANHEDMLARYNGDHIFNPGDIPIVKPAEDVDPSSLFAADYQTVYFANFCWTDENFSADVSESTARIAVADPLEADVKHDVIAATTTVTMARGTSLTLTSEGWAQATLYFADRDLVCEFPGDEGDYAVLTNPGEPVVKLTVYDDTHANTIVIEEN